MNFRNRSTKLHHGILAATLLLFCCVSGELAYGGKYSFGDSGTKNDACMACHGVQAKVGTKNYIEPVNFGHTTHAKFGCTTCHDAITGSHPDGKGVTRTTSCTDCHSDVVTQYSESVHASKAQCNGCHNPHRVYKPDEISADDMNKQCAGCHGTLKITASHARWLPQTESHLAAITCVTCHSKAESYVITIYIAKRLNGDSESKPEIARFDELRKRAAGDHMQFLVDRNRDNYISLDELRSFNRNPVNKDLYLKSVLTPVKPTHSFQTFDNRWDCSFCHTSGQDVMQVSYLAFPERNGTFRKLPVERGAVMDALHTLPDFYLMGSTRNGILNKIGLLIILGGLSMPVGHGFLRFLTRKNRHHTDNATDSKKVYLQPLPVRLWHWLNAFGIITLIISGAQIRFPEFVTVCGSYRSAIMLHNTAGLVVAVSFSIWFFYYKMVSGNMTELYIPKARDLTTGAVRQFVFYFFDYFFGAPNPHHATPENKFNPLQKSAYLAIMFVLMPFVSLTGILLMNIGPMRELVLMIGGLKILDVLHFLLACSLCAFLFTHVYLATLGSTPMAYLKTMWTGWDRVNNHDEQHDAHGQHGQHGAHGAH